MDYREFPPSASLEMLIECFWHLRGAGSGSWDSIYPDACCELVFNLGEPAEERHRERLSLQPQHLVHGQIHERILLRSAPVTEVLGIRLRPWGASALLQLPGGALTAGAQALDAVAPALAPRLISIVEDTAPVATRIRRLDSCLGDWVRRRNIKPPPLGRLARHLQMTPAAGAPDIAELTGWSRRTAQRRFQVELGLTPKRFEQITRFLRFLRRLDLEPNAKLAELAVAAGYYDQPHLHRDLRRFTGETPAAFRARRRGAFDPLYSGERLDRLVAI